VSERLPDLRILFRSDLLAMGWPGRTVDGLFRRCGRREPGCRRTYVLERDLLGVDTDRCLPTPPASEPVSTISRGVGTAYIVARGEGKRRRFLVRFKLGGRAAKVEHAGSFRTKGEAVLRKQFVAGLIAAGRGHDVHRALRLRGTDALTVTEAGKRWLRSRIDVSESTKRIHGDSLRRLEDLIGDVPVDELDAGQVMEAVAILAETHKPSTTRKSLNVLQQALTPRSRPTRRAPRR